MKSVLGIFMGLTMAFVASPLESQVIPEVPKSDEPGEVKLITETLPSADEVLGHFEGGATHEVQVRGLDLDADSAQVFLATDSSENLLHQIGSELDQGQQVKFRGTVDGLPFETRVKRHDNDELRARIEGMDLDGRKPEDFVELFNVGFDRLRVRGLDNHERHEIDRKDNGALRARFEGVDFSAIDRDQLAELMNTGFERVRVRSLDGQRFEIDRKDGGELRARIERMNVSEQEARALVDSLRDKGVDRIRIRGVDDDGKRVRIEFRADKGFVRGGEGIREHARGRRGTNSDINADLVRDMKKDLLREFRGRERSEMGRRARDRIGRINGGERIDRSGRGGRDRLDKIRDRVDRSGRGGRDRLDRIRDRVDRDRSGRR